MPIKNHFKVLRLFFPLSMNSNMTKKQKLKRNSFAADFNAREDDFILADLNVMLDEEEPSPVPLNHFLDDEETIDRLLINSGFDANDELDEDNSEPVKLLIDDISRANKFDVQFEEQNAMAADAGNLDSTESELALDKDATNVFLVKEETPESAKQAAQAISETTYPKEEALESLNNEAGITMLSSVRFEQKAIKKQINHYKNKVKKAAIISYTSLSFGILALLSTVVMGVIVSGMQTKVSKLTELVSIIEEDINSIAEKNSDMEINNNDSSIEQLNQKVNGIPMQSEEKSQFSSGMLANETRAVVAKQATVNKSLDDPQTRANVLEKKKLSEVTVEKVSAEKKAELQKHLIGHSQSSADPSKSNMTVAKKKLAVNKSIDNQETKTHVVEKKRPSETTVKITSAKKKTNSAQTAAGWSVLLTAYEDLSYAKSKAAKFIQKGIPVKVIAVNMNNTTWYRLKVGGFKNKEKATSYAARIKKSLKLNTVSVGNM